VLAVEREAGLIPLCIWSFWPRPHRSLCGNGNSTPLYMNVTFAKFGGMSHLA